MFAYLPAKIFWTAAEISVPIPSPGIKVTFLVPEAYVLAPNGANACK